MFEFYELHDFDGVVFYRWDTVAQVMEFLDKGEWYPSFFTPATLMYYAEEGDDVMVFETDEGSVE